MLKKIIAFLILFSIIHPVSALDPFITINVPVEEEPTKGLYLNPEHLSTTFQQGENISIFNDDRNRRYFTVVCDRNIFDNGTSNTQYLRYRNRAYMQLNEPGIYNFYLLDKPTVKLQITVIGDGTSTEVQETQDGKTDISGKDEFFPGMGELPAPGILATYMLLVLAFLTIRYKK
ncbi:MAG: hypothetical protein K0A89_01760 [ANME-2 cluster archaeon]|nr:hypothetical protein [ANME-2 cluster archaeon]